MRQVRVDMRRISASRSGLAVGRYVQGLSDGKVDVWNVSVEAEGLGENTVQEVGVERDDGSEGEFEIELQVWIGGCEVCGGQG